MERFDWSWFISSADHTNQVLAAALTAIATNRDVYCTINDPVQAWLRSSTSASRASGASGGAGSVPNVPGRGVTTAHQQDGVTRGLPLADLTSACSATEFPGPTGRGGSAALSAATSSQIRWPTW